MTDFEAAWWGQCLHTYGEETKQLTYAKMMGLEWTKDDGRWPVFDLANRSVLDIGGGPVSLLLKCANGARRSVVDPCPYPEWVAARYEAAGIDYIVESGEDFSLDDSFDEAWIYNVLQHVRDPEALIHNARAHAKKIRLFEWIEIPAHEGHPHRLRAKDLDCWLGRRGMTGYLNDSNCVGPAYYGVF